MYTFIVYLITAIVIGGLLYLLFRRPNRDAQYDKDTQTTDNIAKDRDKYVSDQNKWNGLQ